MPPDFMIANKVHARIKLNADGETYAMNADKQTRFFVSKKDFSVYEITGFYNDFLGFKEKPAQWDNYLSINNNKGFVSYSSFELKQKLKEILTSDKIDDQLIKRILDLNGKLNENDNPILIIGNLKTNIQE